MAERVFFSFHYADVASFRVNVVRNHWLTKQDRDDAGYFDASVWESARRQGDEGLKRLINDALVNTSNTCVLVGSETYARPWVRYELLKSFLKGNHLFAVNINGIRAKDGTIKRYGPNPLEYVGVSYSQDGSSGTLYERTGESWREYNRIEGSPRFRCNVGQEFRGNGYNLAQWFRIYDWILNDGYNNFAKWVK